MQARDAQAPNQLPRRPLAPFATRWRVALVIGPIVYWVYRLTTPGMIEQFSSTHHTSYPFAINYGPWAVSMLTPSLPRTDI